MRLLPKSKRDRIINWVFSGKTYRETSDIENVSIGKISDILRDFIGAAEESSIREAAEEYSVEEKIDRLLELTKERRELKVSLPDLLAAARLVRLMRTRGLEASQLEDYMKMCDKYKEDLPNFASKATELYRMEERTDKSYEKIVGEFPTLVKKETELQGKVKEIEVERRRETKRLKEETRQAKEDLDLELASNNLIRKEIPFASALKKSLHRHGYTIRDTSAIPKLLREIEICGGDVNVFIQRAEEVKDLKWEILNLTDEKKRLEPIVADLKNEGVKLQKKRDDLLEEITNLEITKGKLQNENMLVDEKVAAKSDDLRLVNCLTSILSSKPADTDILYKYTYWIREIAHGRRSDLIQRRPPYEKEVRRLIADTFAEYLKDELAPRQEVTKLQKKLKDKEDHCSILSDNVQKLESMNKKLSTDNIKFEKRVKQFKEDLRECEDRLLRDPLIKSKDKRLPFDPSR